MAEVSFKTDVFEGPLDLLLHLISKNKVSIYDIPISEITEQYFEYLDMCDALDMELSSEFVVMASQLLLIKSRLLLPKYDEEEEDPRLELAERLAEYKRYKEISKEFDRLQHATDDIFFKSPEKLDIPRVIIENKSMRPDALYKAFLTVMERNLSRKPLVPQNFTGIVGRPKASVPQQSRVVMEVLKRKGDTPFESLFDGMHTKGELVAAFVAVLELIRDGHMAVFENEGQIICQRCDDFDGYDDGAAED